MGSTPCSIPYFDTPKRPAPPVSYTPRGVPIVASSSRPATPPSRQESLNVDGLERMDVDQDYSSQQSTPKAGPSRLPNLNPTSRRTGGTYSAFNEAQAAWPTGPASRAGSVSSFGGSDAGFSVASSNYLRNLPPMTQALNPPLSITPQQSMYGQSAVAAYNPYSQVRPLSRHPSHSSVSSTSQRFQPIEIVSSRGTEQGKVVLLTLDRAFQPMIRSHR